MRAKTLTILGLVLLSTIGVKLAPRSLKAKVLPKRQPVHLAFLAASNAENPDDSFFKQDLKDFADRLRSRGWKTRWAPSSPQGWPAALQNAQASLQEGDSFLVILHGHGSERELAYGQLTHTWMLDSRGVDVDTLQAPLQTARLRKVRTALVDLSCYSGATQAFQGASCTVTLAAPGYLSLCSGRPEERLFSSHFFDLPEAKTKTDLETQFLSARKEEEKSTNLPQISSRTTPGLQLWDDLLRELDPLDAFDDLRNLRKSPQPLNETKFQERFSKLPGLTASHRERLAIQLKQAFQARRELERQMDPLFQDYKDHWVELSTPGGSRKVTAGHLGDLLDRPENLSAPAAELLRDLQDQEPFPPEEKGLPALTDYRKRREKFESGTRELEVQAGKLLNLEREIYQAHSEPVPGQPGMACREFSL